MNVNSHVIKSNARKLREGSADLAAPVAVRRGKGGRPAYARRVVIVDKDGEEVGSFEYEALGGLKCGARVFAALKYKPRLEG